MKSADFGPFGRDFVEEGLQRQEVEARLRLDVWQKDHKKNCHEVSNLPLACPPLHTAANLHYFPLFSTAMPSTRRPRKTTRTSARSWMTSVRRMRMTRNPSTRTGEYLGVRNTLRSWKLSSLVRLVGRTITTSSACGERVNSTSCSCSIPPANSWTFRPNSPAIRSTPNHGER